MTPLTALYRKHLEARLFTPATVRGHMGALARFIRWLKDKDLRDVILQDLLDYHGQLDRRRDGSEGVTSIQYRNIQMRVLVNFFIFLHERGKILVNPCEDFPVLRRPRLLPKGVLTNAQMLGMLAQPNTNTATGYRDRTVLELLYSCGLRGQELCNLTIYDVDLTGLTVRVNQGKGKKDRIVPLGRVAAGYVKEYLARVRPILMARGSYQRRPVDLLFLGNFGDAINRNILLRLVRRCSKGGAIPPSVTAHGIRHACATEMLKGGASVRHVQELLGHSNILSTQIYTHVAPVDLQRVHASTAPSERRRKSDVPAFELRGFVDMRYSPKRKRRKRGKRS